MTTQTLAVQDINSFVFASNDDIKTTSLLVAEKFGKLHKNVLRDIDRILTQVSDSFGKLNFELTQIDTIMPTGGVRKDRVFNITKDGFMILVMGFTGAAAMEIKEAYINAFNAMHAKLFPKRNGLVELPKPETLESIRRKVIERWIVLAEIFGNQLINEYGTDVPKVWSEEFETLTDEQFKCGIEGIKKSRSPFMPRLPVFLAYCHENDVVTAKHKDMELIEKKAMLKGELLEPAVDYELPDGMMLVPEDEFLLCVKMTPEMERLMRAGSHYEALKEIGGRFINNKRLEELTSKAEQFDKLKGVLEA